MLAGKKSVARRIFNETLKTISKKLSGDPEKVFKLAESALTFHDKPVIFKLPDVVNDKEIRGALRLLNQKSLLKEAAEAFFFVRIKF